VGQRDAYYKKAKELAEAFKDNFKKFSNVSEAIVKQGGPIV